MNAKKKGIILVGSPRGKKSTSTSVGIYLQNLLQARGFDVSMYWILHVLQKEEKKNEMLEAIDDADAIILPVPLYVDSLPYITTKVMELIAARRKGVMIGRKQKKQQFVPIVNSGFPEPVHNHTAMVILKKFASKVGLEWTGSISISSGEAFQGSKGVSLEECGDVAEELRNLLRDIAEVMEKGETFRDECIITLPKIFFKWYMKWFGYIMLKIGNRGWKKQSKSHGQQVNARPYIQ